MQAIGTSSYALFEAIFGGVPSVVIAILIAGLGIVLYVPLHRSASARRQLKAEQAEHDENRKRLERAEEALQADRFVMEGLEDQIQGYKKTMADLLSGVDVATAYFGHDGRLMAWTEGFQDTIDHPQDQLERGAPFEHLLPLVQREGDAVRAEASVASTSDFLETVGQGWATSLLQTREGQVVKGRCCRVSQGWIVTLVDESEDQALDILQAELREARADLDRFLYIAGHDLRAPLRALRTLPEWIEEEITTAHGPPKPEITDLLYEMRVQAERLDQLLISILAYSRVGKYDDEITRIDLGQIIEETKLAVDLPPDFALEIAGELPDLAAVPNEASQVFQALISNAVKHHSGKTGRILLTCTVEQGQNLIRVEDDGPGIEPQFHERIFEIFSTLKSRDEVEGSGMGLPIARKIAERWGGSLTVTEGTLGGACFTLSWPATVPETVATVA